MADETVVTTAAPSAEALAGPEDSGSNSLFSKFEHLQGEVDDDDAGDEGAEGDTTESDEEEESEESEGADTASEDEEGDEDEDSDDEETEATKKAKEALKKKDEKKEDEEAPKQGKRKVKIALSDDEETVIDGNQAKVSVKINGKVEVKTVGEIIDAYSSREALKQQYDTVAAQKNEAIQYREQADEKIGTVNNLIGALAKDIQEGNVIPALNVLFSSIEGVDALTTIKSIRKGLIEAVRQYDQLSPEQQRLMEISEERDLYASKEQARAERDKQEKIRAEQEQQIGRVLTDFQFSDRQTYNEYRSRLEQDVSNGAFPSLKEKPITPDLVGQYYEAFQIKSRVQSAVRAVNPSLANDTQVLSDLAIQVSQLKLSPKELKRVVREVYGSGEVIDETVKTLNGKVGNKKLSKKPTISSSVKTKPGTKSADSPKPFSWDDV